MPLIKGPGKAHLDSPCGGLGDMSARLASASCHAFPDRQL